MSTGSVQAFRHSGSIWLSAGTTSVNAALPPGGEALVIYNATGDIAYVAVGGDNTIVATNDTGPAQTDLSYPVPPYSRALLHCGAFAQYVAVVLSSGSGGVIVSRGDGTQY
jgi:hypothetical protein